MVTLLKEVKSYRAGIVVLEDTERREFWGFADGSGPYPPEWNGEHYFAWECDAHGYGVKNGRQADVCEVMTWDEENDTGNLIGYALGTQTITVRPEKMLDVFIADNRTPEDCRLYKAPDGKIFAVSTNPDGEEHDYIMLDVNTEALTMQASPEEVKALAKKYNSDYDCYQGWSDLHILLDACEQLCSCEDCPFAADCDLAQELTGDYIDADGEVYKEA